MAKAKAVQYVNADPVWPSKIGTFSRFAPRHRTIGQLSSVEKVELLKAHVEIRDGIPYNEDAPISDLSAHVAALLVERVQPEGKQSKCRVETAFVTTLQARMALWAGETLRGFDNTASRVAAIVFSLNLHHREEAGTKEIYGPESDWLDRVFAFTFAGTQSTPAYTMAVKLGELLDSVARMADLVEYLDNTQGTVETQAVKSAAVETVSGDLSALLAK